VLAAAALGLCLGSFGPSVPFRIAGAGAVCVLAILGWRGGFHALARPSRSGWVIVDGRGVHRVDAHRATTLAAFGEPLGVTVFASADRATLSVALTSPRAARYVGVVVRDAADATAGQSLIARAMTVAEADLRGGPPGSLSASDAARLVDAVAARAPDALDRVYLSGAAGELIMLAPAELRIGAKQFDLNAPLEWRAFLFQELGACAVSVCQATWVRQADVEAVLVASMPSEGGQFRETDAAVRAAGEGATARRALARDVRLMGATASDPPPRELRCAIDRTFMLSVRHALDRAPRASRSALPPSPSWRSGSAPGAPEKTS
jgi:hypothetical protein